MVVGIRFRETDEVRRELEMSPASLRGLGGLKNQAGSQRETEIRDTPHGNPVGLSGSDSRHMGL